MYVCTGSLMPSFFSLKQFVTTTLSIPSSNFLQMLFHSKTSSFLKLLMMVSFWRNRDKYKLHGRQCLNIKVILMAFFFFWSYLSLKQSGQVHCGTFLIKYTFLLISYSYYCFDKAPWLNETWRGKLVICRGMTLDAGTEAEAIEENW